MTAHARFVIDCDTRPRFTGAYLRVAGDECAFIETHTSHARPRLIAELAARGRRRQDVRWVVVTHAHLDHAAGAGELLAHCPNATLLAHPRAARNLIDPTKLIASATKVYGEARFAELYGTIAPIPQERVRALEDGETFELGDARFTVHHTAGHAKHHLIVDDPELDTVYTGDAFGLVYPDLQHGKRFAIASTSPIDFDAIEAHRSIDEILSLGRRNACLTHFDEVTDLDEIAAQVRAWIDRSERWLEESAATSDELGAMASPIEKKLRSAVAEDTSRRGLSFGDSDWELLSLDLELNAQGIAFAAYKRREDRQANGEPSHSPSS